MRSFLLTLLICLLLPALRAQESGRIFALINEANELSLKEPARAMDTLEKALSLSFTQKNRRAEGFCYHSIGGVNYQLARYTKAAENFSKALALFKELGEEKGYYNAARHLGAAWDGAGDYDRALKSYEAFLLMTQKTEAVSDEITTMRRIARIYYNRQQYVLALGQYRKVLSLELSRENPAGVSEMQNRIGQVYLQLGDTALALTHFKEAGVLAEAAGASQQANQSYDKIGKAYRGQRAYQQELNVRQQALESNRKLGDKASEFSNTYEIGTMYLEQNKPEEAIPYLQATINLAGELGRLEALPPSSEAVAQAYEQLALPGADYSDVPSEDKTSQQQAVTPREVSRQIKSQAYEALADAYARQGEYEKALASLQESRAIQDSLNALREQALLAALDANRELSLKDEELRRMQHDQELRDAELRRQRLLSGLLVAGLLGAMVAVFFILKSNTAKRRANKLLALKSLRSQMNPHFIFNSLNSVNSFISRNDERSANKFLTNFSRLMRTVMEHSSHEFVPLSEELRVLQLYLELEHFRFEDKFAYTFQVDETIDPENMLVPPMLVQPYIENAIWHGLRYKQEKGMLKVAFSQEGERLICRVEDDGIGRARSQELKTKHQREHTSTGLRNTAERIDLINSLYKTRLQVHVEDLYPGQPDPGTCVNISIPLLREKK